MPNSDWPPPNAGLSIDTVFDYKQVFKGYWFKF
jgi:hypothetical protein